MLNGFFLKIELTICIKIDLGLNNQPRLICHKNERTNQPTTAMISPHSDNELFSLVRILVMNFPDFYGFLMKLLTLSVICTFSEIVLSKFWGPYHNFFVIVQISYIRDSCLSFTGS